ncbi:DNA mismatch repair protein MutS [Acidithiobacillus marinus]|uniref:DNA mismatch repair protein MutS n=1 Tax=Acidithiobacillus marinus TaxID=187490 RepID=A0A2I1DQD3_9PROT|nr:Smr/MutS family protein [Acidithiobacillus marinus]PKY12090.1 DNA mismatch repair protein MutS [Acidithiobacillus marinus]
MRRRRPTQQLPVKPAVLPEEKAYFEAAMADVKRFSPPPVPARPAPPAPVAAQRQKEALEVRAALSRPLSSDEILEAGDEWLYLQSGQSPALLRDLRRGRIRIQSRLDLHGCNVEEARLELAAFLHDARQWRWNCVCIVHGKGLGSPGRIPVLKRLVGAWLMRHQEVLAFAQARPGEGGSGALRVLLGWRRQRQQN